MSEDLEFGHEFWVFFLYPFLECDHVGMYVLCLDSSKDVCSLGFVC